MLARRPHTLDNDYRVYADGKRIRRCDRASLPISRLLELTYLTPTLLIFGN